jgi:hypothetical protein
MKRISLVAVQILPMQDGKITINVSANHTVATTADRLLP